MKEPIKVYFYDTTYEGGTDEESVAYKRSLEIELGKTLEVTNIGAGADVPAFVLDLLDRYEEIALVLYLFFKGEAIRVNLDEWATLAKRLRGLKKYAHVLGRGAAIVRAVEKYCSTSGQALGHIRLLAYEAFDRRMGRPPAGYRPSHIDPPVAEERISDTIHIFLIEGDDSSVVFTIDQSEVDILV